MAAADGNGDVLPWPAVEAASDTGSKPEAAAGDALVAIVVSFGLIVHVFTLYSR